MKPECRRAKEIYAQLIRQDHRAPDEEMAELNSHFRTCADCQLRLKRFAAIAEGLKLWFSPSVRAGYI